MYSWLTKDIPNDWCDKDELIRITLFAILVNFIEEEQPSLDIDWSEDLKNGYISNDYVEKWNEHATALKAVYDYIKRERPILERKLNEALHSFNKDNYWGLENNLTEKDNWACQAIVKYRGYLWT